MCSIPVGFKKKKKTNNKPIKTQTTLQGDWKTLHNQISEEFRSTRNPERQK